MPQEANGDNLYIGAGKWYFDRFDAVGNSTGLRFLGENQKAEITPTTTNKEAYTATKASRVKIADVITQQKHTLAIEPMEWIKENVALAFLGSTAALTQATATVTTEPLIAGANQPATAAKGMIFQTAKRGISAVTLHATAGGSPEALVLGIDYEIEDSKLGLISLISDAADNATALTIDYTAASVTSTRVTAGLTTKIEGRMVFIGDPTSGPVFDVEFFRVKVSPSGAIALLGEDFGSMPLSVEILDDSANGHSGLYQLTYR